LQPKTIETLKQMRLAEPVLRKGAKIYDICYWNSEPGKPMRRTKREVHYPPVVDVLEPFILLVHQGMIEELFLDDMAERGAGVERNCVFRGCEVVEGEEFPVETVYTGLGGVERRVRAKYLVGCDGAHSAVRRSIGVEMRGEGTDVFWGVLDGVINTDFPDLWSKWYVSLRFGWREVSFHS
jgi:phenol 2-monooxygenase